ncbi:MAG: hypothetical protein RR672_11785, partial [Raoultibacter sp.]
DGFWHEVPFVWQSKHCTIRVFRCQTEMSHATCKGVSTLQIAADIEGPIWCNELGMIRQSLVT